MRRFTLSGARWTCLRQICSNFEPTSVDLRYVWINSNRSTRVNSPTRTPTESPAKFFTLSDEPMKNNFSAASRRSALPFLCLLLLTAAPLSVSAQDAGGNPANWCRNGAFASDANAFKVARVRGVRGSRAYFYGED